MIEYRKSRFYDEKGNPGDVGGVIYAPLALATATMRKLFDYRPKWPTLSFRAIKVIDYILEPSFRCVEFGSGMSTPWLAKRCNYLLSIENDKAWYDRVSAMIAANSFSHVRHELREANRYSDLSDHDDGLFDFVLVDGLDRHGCVISAVPKIRPGGWIYLDNSDKDMTKPEGDVRLAEAALLEAVAKRGGSTRYFVDFSVTNFFVEQGLLVRL